MLRRYKSTVMKALSLKWVFVILLSFMAFVVLLNTTVYGQAKKQGKKHPHTNAKKPGATWAGPASKERVYFPDYYTFYDPSRNAYVYWQEDKWVTSPEKPFFMKDANMGKARVQILQNDQLTMPEDRFEQYMRLYPAQPVSPTVPVPIITISKQKQ